MSTFKLRIALFSGYMTVDEREFLKNSSIWTKKVKEISWSFSLFTTTNSLLISLSATPLVSTVSTILRLLSFPLLSEILASAEMLDLSALVLHYHGYHADHLKFQVLQKVLSWKAFPCCLKKSSLDCFGSFPSVSSFFCSIKVSFDTPI